MPGKGRRVASRQAQLGRRRRKAVRGNGAVPLAQAPAAVVDSQPADAVDTQPQEPVATTRTERQTAPVRPVPATLPRGPRARAERPTAYNYVGHEVRRILIMAGISIVVLIALAFFV